MNVAARSDGNTLSGISTLVFGLFLFNIQDNIIKLFSDQYSVLEIVTVRAVVALVIMSAMVYLSYGPGGFISAQPRLLLVRGMFMFASYLTYYMAIATLSLADLVAIVFTAPILVTALSALWLKERVGTRRWVAVAVGFLGVVVVVNPGGSKDPVGVLLAFAAACTYAVAITTTRFINQGDQPWTVALYAMASFFAGSLVLTTFLFMLDLPASSNPSADFLLRAWTAPTAADLGLMVAIGVIASAGFYCLSRAYLVAAPSAVAPFEYVYIIFSIIAGWFIWSEAPKPTTLAGVAILIGSSLYILHREIRDARRKPVPQPGPALQNEILSVQK